MATINSTTVKPLDSANRRMELLLVHGNYRLRPASRNVLHAGVLQGGPVDADGCLAWGLRLERQGEDLPVAGDPATAGGARCRELQDASHAVVAMHQSHGLAVLRQHRTIGDIYHLQQVGVV